MDCCLKSKYKIDAITELLPHRATMLLVDGLISFELDKGIQTFFHIRKDNIFLNKKTNKIGSFVAFECIAQSMGVYNGIKNIVINDKTSTPQIGFLISVSNLVCIKPYISVGETIVTHVYDIETTGPMINASATIQNENGEDIMKATVSVLVKV